MRLRRMLADISIVGSKVDGGIAPCACGFMIGFRCPDPGLSTVQIRPIFIGALDGFVQRHFGNRPIGHFISKDDLLFIPLTTAAMDPISNEAMGNATSIFNLMRNIGGSAGIAVTQTMLARGRQRHTSVLGAHVSVYNTATQERLRQLQSAFAAQGADPVTAAQRAQGALWATVQKQAAILTFNDAFRLLGMIFLMVVPLGYVMRRPRSRKSQPVSE